MDLGRRVYVKDAMGEAVLAGFVQDVKDLKNIRFIILRDRSGLIQVTAKRGEVSETLFEKVGKIPRESVIAVNGVVAESPIAKLGKEVLPREIEVLGEAEAAPVIEFQYHDKVRTMLDKRLDFRFLDLRSPRSQAIFKVQNVISQAVHEFFTEEGFVEVHTPKLIAQATESGSTVFPVDYFKRTAYLAQSPQFYKQMLMAAGFEKVFEVGPVFRAEKHHTPRHLCEYTSIDFELSFIRSHEDVMQVVESMVVHALKRVLRKCGEELETLQVKPTLPRTPFPRVTVRETYEMLKERGRETLYSQDLDAEGERLFSSVVKEVHGCDFAFLTEFSWLPDSRPFYVMRKDDEPDWTYSFDLIWNGLEVTTGGQREHRYARLKQQSSEKGYDPRDFEFYLEFFKYGIPPHGGSGTGLERLTMRLLNLENIREAILLPRDPERLTP